MLRREGVCNTETSAHFDREVSQFSLPIKRWVPVACPENRTSTALRDSPCTNCLRQLIRAEAHPYKVHYAIPDYIPDTDYRFPAEDLRMRAELELAFPIWQLTPHFPCSAVLVPQVLHPPSFGIPRQGFPASLRSRNRNPSSRLLSSGLPSPRVEKLQVRNWILSITDHYQMHSLPRRRVNILKAMV